MFLKTIDDFNDLILTNIISMFIVLRNCHEIIDFFFFNGLWTYNLSYMRNATFTILLQQILSDSLIKKKL